MGIISAILNYVEISSLVAVVVVILCGVLSYIVSMRRPLYYNLFVVEMHTWTTRRMVQVLHLGQEFTPPVSWDRLVQRMRARAPRIQGENRIAISDTNIVIQSPNTVIDSPAPARSPDVDLITLWDIEMPPPTMGHVPDATRDSQYAAAAAIAILARGDDASLMSRVFRNQERSAEDGVGIAPTFEERRNGPMSNYVTTDVTYTTPSISPDMQHQFSTRTSNVTQSHPPTHEMVADHPDENDSDEEDSSDDDDETDDDSIDLEDTIQVEMTSDGPQAVEAEINEEREAKLAREAREAEYAVIEGPSEGKVLIRLKFLSDMEKDTYASLEDTVAKFKREHFMDLSNKVIRLIYQGQLLREESKTLHAYGLQAGSIVHCHISVIPYTRPGVATLPPMVNNQAPVRRRRQQNEERIAMRQAVQERNVGQVYLLLSTMVPILSGLGLAFFRPDRIRDLLRPATILTLSQWVCNLLADNGILLHYDDEEEQPEANIQTSTLFWIFGGQMVAVSIFLYYFPDVFDRVGATIFLIVFLYFVFVVYSRQRRNQNNNREVQNQNLENQIHQETISLL